MIGRLSAWTIDRAYASGLAGIGHGALVDISGAGLALVTALLADRVELAPLSPRAPRIGAEVRAGGPLATPAGEHMVGRIVDCLGGALDGGPEVARDEVAPIFGRDPAVYEQRGRRVTLGALVYDLQRRIEAGTSLLAVGPREVLRHVLRHQVAAGRLVVVATPAATSAAHLAALRGSRVPGLPEEPVRCVHVAAPLAATPAQQWLVPWAAMAIASSLRARGRDVVVAIDHLDAWKPHVQRFAERGSWATQLAQLASRAYSGPSGSVTLIGMTSKPSVARASAFDAVLDLSLAVRGEIPVTGTKRVAAPIRVASVGQLARACYLSALLASFEQRGLLHEGIDDRTHRDLEEARRLRECLRVRRGSTLDSLEQELGLLAVAALPAVPSHAVGTFVEAYLAKLRLDHAGALAAIRAAGRLDAHDERALLGIAAEVATPFVAR